MFLWQPWLVSLAATALFMTVVWSLHLRDRDASIVDPLWGPAILTAGIAYCLAAGRVPTGWHFCVLLVPIAWAARLCAHLAGRHARQGEDRRYRQMREKRGDAWWWQSLPVVFLLQAVLAWIVALPLMALTTTRDEPGVLVALGVVVALAGFLFEAVADGQLAHFIRGEAERLEQAGEGAEKGVMDRGLWRYSRHPNYFGESVVWWGLGISAVGAGAPWALIGPATITFMLLRVSGVTMTEADIAERRPAYRAYVERTNAFLPGPPRASAAR